jgi:hypothetical protein
MINLLNNIINIVKDEVINFSKYNKKLINRKIINFILILIIIIIFLFIYISYHKIINKLFFNRFKNILIYIFIEEKKNI